MAETVIALHVHSTNVSEGAVKYHVSTRLFAPSAIASPDLHHRVQVAMAIGSSATAWSTSALPHRPLRTLVLHSRITRPIGAPAADSCAGAGRGVTVPPLPQLASPARASTSRRQDRRVHGEFWLGGPSAGEGCQRFLLSVKLEVHSRGKVQCYAISVP